MKSACCSPLLTHQEQSIDQKAREKPSCKFSRDREGSNAGLIVYFIQVLHQGLNHGFSSLQNNTEQSVPSDHLC